MPRNGTKTMKPVRTTRIPDDVWDVARARAEKDGVSMSQMMQRLVEGYARGKIALPRVELVYDKPRRG